MKPSATRVATARVLAEIDDAVRPVERARTAAAVDRVLASAAPCIWGAGCGEDVTDYLCDQLGLGFDAAVEQHDDKTCPCTRDDYPERASLPGLVAADSGWFTEYQPRNVSPHLFPTDPR